MRGEQMGRRRDKGVLCGDTGTSMRPVSAGIFVVRLATRRLGLARGRFRYLSLSHTALVIVWPILLPRLYVISHYRLFLCDNSSYLISCLAPVFFSAQWFGETERVTTVVVHQLIV